MAETRNILTEQEIYYLYTIYISLLGLRFSLWGSDFFCVLLWLILDISLYFLYNINISGIGWLVGGSFMGETFLAINVTV